MNHTATQPQEQHQANLIVLHRQLQEIAAQAKSSIQASRKWIEDLQGPVLVIRGK